MDDESLPGDFWVVINKYATIGLDFLTSVNSLHTGACAASLPN